ncbi:hypothetical protein PAMP_009515 [Pampus punctatissimus]
MDMPNLIKLCGMGGRGGMGCLQMQSALLSNERGRQTRVENGRSCRWSFSGNINRERNRRQS